MSTSADTTTSTLSVRMLAPKNENSWVLASTRGKHPLDRGWPFGGGQGG